MNACVLRLTLAATVAAAALLGGCAALRSVSSDVSSYGEWPAGRKPGAYAFERLPSQQARAAESEQLESSARAALAKAGFVAADAGQQPELLVQVGALDGRVGFSPWDDPLWWRGGFGGWHHGPWGSPRWGWSMRYEVPRYEREVALLIRERASGKPLYESHARSEGNTRSDPALLGAMFEAAMMDFPQQGMNPRRVVVELAP
jgi:hypothetical protein